MVNKKISIIVPIYNTEEYLEKCINSLINQKYKSIEIILVNDGSTDGSLKICNFYQKKDPRIVVISKKHTGVSDTRNVGIQQATGDYIGFVDSDDYVDPDMFYHLIIGLQKYHAQIAMCDLEETENQTNEKINKNVDYIEMTSKQALQELLYDKNIGNYLVVKLFSKKVFSGIKFPVGRLYEDIAVAYKLFLKATKIVYIPLPMYHYFQRKESIVNHITRKSIEDYLKALFERYYNLKDSSTDLNLYNVYSIVNVVIKMSVWAIRIKDYELYDDTIQEYFNKMKEELVLVKESELMKLFNDFETEAFFLGTKDLGLLREWIKKKYGNL